MNTNYDEIYGLFTSKIKDHYFNHQLEMDFEFAEILMLGYLKYAIPRFTYCVQNLSLRDDEIGTFEIELSEMEKEILATFMVAAYLNPKINSDDYLLRHLGSKDYIQFSPNNQLKELKDLQKNTVNEANSLMIEYYYRQGL